MRDEDKDFWEQVDLVYEKYRDDELLKKYEEGR